MNVDIFVPSLYKLPTGFLTNFLITNYDISCDWWFRRIGNGERGRRPSGQGKWVIPWHLVSSGVYPKSSVFS